MRTKPYATAIALFDEVELLDVAGPLSLLSGAGRQWNFQPFRVELVARAQTLVATRSGVALQATTTFADAPTIECLIVPGGYGALRAADDPELLAWLSRTAGNAELVAAVGNGVWLLAKAGLLSNIEVSAPHELSAALRAEYPRVTLGAPDGVCVAGKFFTAGKSALGLDLACELVSRTFGKKLASTLSSSLGVGWSGELESIEIVPGLLPLR